MVAKAKYSVLFNMLLVVGCGETAPDDHSQGNSSDPNSQRSVGYALQADEGDVLFGGPRGGKVIIKVDPAKTGSPQMAIGFQYLTDGVAAHRHESEEEVLFVHQGKGIGTLGGEEVQLEAGTMIYVPPGTWHSIEQVETSEQFISMWIVTPGTGEATQLDKFFRETRSPAGEEPKKFTPEQFEEILHKHGMTSKNP